MNSLTGRAVSTAAVTGGLTGRAVNGLISRVITGLAGLTDRAVTAFINKRVII